MARESRIRGTSRRRRCRYSSRCLSRVLEVPGHGANPSLKFRVGVPIRPSQPPSTTAFASSATIVGTHVSPRPTPCAVVSTTNPVRSGESERRGQGIAAAANLVRSGASLATILSIVVALQRRHHATAHRPHCRPPRLFRHAARAGALRKADDPWFKALVRKSAGRRVLFVGDRCEPPHERRVRPTHRRALLFAANGGGAAPRLSGLAAMVQDGQKSPRAGRTPRA